MTADGTNDRLIILDSPCGNYYRQHTFMDVDSMPESLNDVLPISTAPSDKETPPGFKLRGGGNKGYYQFTFMEVDAPPKPLNDVSPHVDDFCRRGKLARVRATRRRQWARGVPLTSSVVHTTRFLFCTLVSDDLGGNEEPLPLEVPPGCAIASMTLDVLDASLTKRYVMLHREMDWLKGLTTRQA